MKEARFAVISLAVPTVASALGIDGAAIFQILASESLRLEPRVIGVALGLGVVSVPLQLAAARTPLWRARARLVAFLMLAAAGCLVLGALVALDTAGSRLALLALAVTVLAEIGVSVLYAPSWHPLMSYALTTQERQRVNSRARAAGALIAAGAMVAFGAAHGGVRALLLGAFGAVAVGTAVIARRIPAPGRPAAPLRVVKARIPAAIKPVYLSVAVGAGAATWPLFLVYAREVLWPAANLGLLGAVHLAGSLVASLAWRPTEGDILRRALRAGVALVAAALAVAAVRAPVTGLGEQAATLLALFVAGAVASVMLMSFLERAHRAVDEETSVRALTVFDVVASTSIQLGLVAAGFLITASANRPEWPVDPYRLFLLGGSLVVVLVLAAQAPRPDRIAR